MPSKWWVLCEKVGVYLKEIEERGYSEYTIRDYRYALETQFRALHDANMEVNAKKIGREELEYLRDEYFDASPRHKSNMINMLICFCKWAGNTEIGRIKLNFGDTSRKNIRWLDDGQVSVLRNVVETPLEHLLVHCELGLGMRRIEVQRLRLDSFHSGRMSTVSIHGKGRNGGKHRSIPIRPDTRTILEEYLAYRRTLLHEAMKVNPDYRDEGSLVVYQRAGALHSYGKTGIDKILERISRRCGFVLSNHDLRRTCGRRMYHAGMDIEEIRAIFGHEDAKMTRKYLGLEYDDLSESMRRYCEYDRIASFPKKEETECIQIRSGQGGI